MVREGSTTRFEMVRAGITSSLDQSLSPSLTKENRVQHLLIIHALTSHPAWTTVIDLVADICKRGEIPYQLLRFDNDANDVTHFSVCASLDKARRFFESPECGDPGASRSEISQMKNNRKSKSAIAPPAYSSG